MGLIVDTSVLLAAERGTFRLLELLESAGDEAVFISAVTASELLHGCHRAKDGAVRERRLAFVEALLHLIPTCEFGLGEARSHARLWAHFAGKGTLIGAHDMLIAASCIARGHALATLDLRDFARVPGLRLAPVTDFADKKIARPRASGTARRSKQK